MWRVSRAWIGGRASREMLILPSWVCFLESSLCLSTTCASKTGCFDVEEKHSQASKRKGALYARELPRIHSRKIM